ncbi:TPA: FRG domain-containing protein, partial [Legionella pneumophila]|nr:FRG domain-containing protein [Legionella pneumophila]
AIAEEDTFIKNENLIYRGHQDPKWNLIPTLKRTHSKLENKDIINLLNTFKNALKGIEHYELHDLEHLNENQLWALGRHYGLPTPIIDWTYNAKIALYFAFENRANLHPYHSVYILDTKKIYDSNIVHFDNRPHQNEREKLQKGCYTRTRNYQNIEQLITDDKNNHVYFRKLYIKKNSPQECLNALEIENISKLFLYPKSIEGVVEYCKTKIPSPYEYQGQIMTIRFV